MRQNAEIYFGILAANQQLPAPLSELDGTWIHLIKGQLPLLGGSLAPGDSASIDHSAPGFALEASENAEFLLFGINYFAPFLGDMPKMEGHAAAFIGALAGSGYLGAIKVIEIIGGALTISGRYTPSDLRIRVPTPLP